jgi:anti-sigma B factor antagonist
MNQATSRAEGERQLGNLNGAGALTFNCVRSPEAPIHILKLEGELDIATAPRLQEEIDRLEEGQPSELVIDLSGLNFIDSTGLRLLLETNDRARTHGMKLRFLRGSEPVTRLLSLTGVDERLPFLD